MLLRLHSANVLLEQEQQSSTKRAADLLNQHHSSMGKQRKNNLSYKVCDVCSTYDKQVWIFDHLLQRYGGKCKCGKMLLDEHAWTHTWSANKRGTNSPTNHWWKDSKYSDSGSAKAPSEVSSADPSSEVAALVAKYLEQILPQPDAEQQKRWDTIKAALGKPAVSQASIADAAADAAKPVSARRKAAEAKLRKAEADQRSSDVSARCNDRVIAEKEAELETLQAKVVAAKSVGDQIRRKQEDCKAAVGRCYDQLQQV